MATAFDGMTRGELAEALEDYLSDEFATQIDDGSSDEVVMLFFRC